MRTRGNRRTQHARSIEHAVLKYLINHREAKDTVQAVQQWWLGDTHIRVQPSKLKSALEKLVRRGWITATQRKGTVTLYALNKDYVQQIDEYLKDNTPRS